MLLIGFDNEKCFFDALLILLLAARTNGDHSAAGLQQSPRAAECFSADRVKNHIDVSDQLLERNALVVDDLIGSEAGDEIQIGGRCCRDDMRAVEVGQLHRIEAHGSCSAVNQNAIASHKLRPLKEALPGCQGTDRNGCGLDVREMRGQRSDGRGHGDAIFCQRSFREPVVHAKDFLADLQRAIRITKSCDDSRELMTRDGSFTGVAVLVWVVGYQDEFRRA